MNHFTIRITGHVHSQQRIIHLNFKRQEGNARTRQCKFRCNIITKQWHRRNFPSTNDTIDTASLYPSHTQSLSSIFTISSLAERIISREFSKFNYLSFWHVISSVGVFAAEASSDHSWGCLPQLGIKRREEGILRMEDAVTSEEDTNSQDFNTPTEHDHLARNCLMKIITLAVKALVISSRYRHWFRGSNPAVVNGFFQSVKILSMTSEPWVPCRRFIARKRTSSRN